MTTASQERLQANARTVHCRGLPQGAAPSAEILDSWGRCVEAGLTADFVPVVPVVSASDLCHRRDRAGLLRHLALAELETLSQQIAGSNFLLAFGDQDGVILDLFHDHRFATSSSGADIVAGSHWTEGFCGTNGLGTALAGGQAVSVNGADHYLSHFGDISCTAAPIRDAWGQLVGVLDASSYFESRQRHTEALVKMASLHIENLLFAHQMRDAVVLAIHPRAEFLGTLSAGLVAFEPSGGLRAVNARARALLSGLCLTSGTGFEELFNTPLDAIRQRLRQGGTVNLHDVLGSALTARAQGGVAIASGSSHFPTPGPSLAAPKADAAGDVNIGGRHYLAADPGVQAALRTVAAAARLNVPVLIHGETGTGKEQLARHAHEVSGRKGAFVAVNCGALPSDLFESELFGHKGGAFTGASRHDKPGLLVSADGGTLLLDELRELPLALQPGLLRFLDDQMVRPVGGTQSRKVDVQIVAACHGDLENEVAAGRFRADLMYRLNTVRVVLPPLRNRRDFADAVWHVLNGLTPCASITPGAIDLLASHSWPGNFRELRAVLTRALLTCNDTEAVLDRTELQPHLPAHGGAGVQGASALYVSATGLVLREFERTGHNVSLTARNLAISRTTVYRHLRDCQKLPAAARRTA